MSFADEHLSRWVSHQKNQELVEAGPVTRFELWHSSVDHQQGPRLEQFEVNSDSDPDDLAQAIWDTAEHDSSTLGSGRPQRYTVQAWRIDKTEPCASHSFLVSGKSYRAHVSGETEPANEKGHLGQLMRHNERTNELMYRVQEASVGRMLKDLEQERLRREKAEERVFNLLTREQDLLDRSQERELERAAALAKAKRIDELMTLAVNMLPVVATRLMAKDGQPTAGSVGASETAVKKILANMGEDELAGVMGALKPHNQLALLELYQAHQDSIQSEEEAKPELFKTPVMKEELPIKKEPN